MINNDDKIINYLGVDWGEKRIGLATADSDVRLSLPFKTVSSLNELLPILEEERIDVVVMGEPVKMSGAEATNSLWLNFKNQLLSKTKIKVVLIDERLSSLAADALGGDDKQRASRDEISASIILQNYLDKNSSNN